MACESCKSGEPFIPFILPSQRELNLRLVVPSLAGPLGLFYTALGYPPDKIVVERPLVVESPPEGVRPITYIVVR